MLVTVDIVIFTIENNTVKVLLQKRNKDPYIGKYAIPGGFIHEDKDDSSLDAVVRVLKTKLGLNPMHLEQYRAISSKDRDSRGWSISDVYYTIVPISFLNPMPVDSILVDVGAVPRDLPMGHFGIIEGAFNRVRSTVTYSSLPMYFFDKPFTLYALQKTYELFKGGPINKVTFRRYIEELDVLEPTGEKDRTRACAPADLYQLKAEYTRNVLKIDKSV